MKVQCDGCEAAEAAVVCCADEAALCKECDIRVHDANKLASKHQRVPLFRPAKDTPCDICQEKTAYFFCLEDRALLCHNCDMSIHRLNPAVSSHRRFLITGVTASLNTLSGQQQQQTAPAAAPPPPPSKTNNQTTSNNSKASRPSLSQQRQPLKAKAKKDDPVTVEVPSTSTSTSTSTSSTTLSTTVAPAPGETDLSKKTSIFEFLTETVPGWKFDELLNMSDTFAGGGGSFMNTADPSPSSSAAAASKLVVDGSFSWPSNIFYEQSFSRSVPEMNTLPTPGLNRGTMDAAAPATSSMKIKQQQQQQDIVFLPETDDAFIVPDLGLHSAPPEIPAVLKRRRTYSELDNIFLS